MSDAFLMAAENGDLEAIAMFLDEGQDIDATDGNGRTALYIATVNGYFDCVKFLIDRGADSDIRAYGSAPVHGAAIKGHMDILKYFIEELGCSVDLQTLSGKHVISDSEVARFHGGRTPLHQAALGNQPECVVYLLGKGADINNRDGAGVTALHSAAKGVSADMARLLVGRGANIDCIDDNGYTALHAAISSVSAMYGAIGSVSYFLEIGLNPLQKNNKGKSALDLAKEIEATETVEEIERFMNAKHEQAALAARIAADVDFAVDEFDL